MLSLRLSGNLFNVSAFGVNGNCKRQTVLPAERCMLRAMQVVPVRACMQYGYEGGGKGRRRTAKGYGGVFGDVEMTPLS